MIIRKLKKGVDTILSVISDKNTNQIFLLIIINHVMKLPINGFKLSCDEITKN